MEKTAAVTGATGFIASHVIRILLEDGWNIRATVRDSSDEGKYSYLKDLPAASGSSLKFFSASLNQEGSFDEALQDCDYVLHLASPYVLDVQDPQKELIDPAVDGTLTVLRSALKNLSIKRVVLTSSVAAITDAPKKGHVYTEKDWNTESSLTRNPYYYSKLLAEQAAWKFMEEEKPHFDLVVMNPYMVIGPELNPNAVNTSNSMFKDILMGKYPGVFSLSWGFVDVRDVAKAHVLAMKLPAAKGRYLLCARSMKMKEVVNFLQKSYSGYSLPSVNLDCKGGTAMIKLGSYFQGAGVGTYLRSNLNKHFEMDNSKAKKELGIEFTDPEESINETVIDLIHKGAIPDLRSNVQ